LVAVDADYPNFHTSGKDLYLVEYDFAKTYIEDYVMRPDGGGGLFVETHNFPHVFIPMSADCQGSLLLGKEESYGLGQAMYTFIGLTIPYGFALVIDNNVIHGDSFFKAKYAVSLSPDVEANTVILYGATRQPQSVKRVPVNTFAAGHSCLPFFKQASPPAKRLLKEITAPARVISV
jgi:hypothetical protein